jgi:hypothetical protein
MRAPAPFALVLLCSCGLTMTTGPAADRPPNERPRCTETYDAPKKDGIGAIVGLLGAVTGGVFFETDHDTAGATFLIGGLVVMAASYASGGIGYFRVKRCKKAIAEFERAQSVNGR